MISLVTLVALKRIGKRVPINKHGHTPVRRIREKYDLVGVLPLVKKHLHAGHRAAHDFEFAPQGLNQLGFGYGGLVREFPWRGGWVICARFGRCSVRHLSKLHWGGWLKALSRKFVAPGILCFDFSIWGFFAVLCQYKTPEAADLLTANTPDFACVAQITRQSSPATQARGARFLACEAGSLGVLHCSASRWQTST
jgi:hypothetical protein